MTTHFTPRCPTDNLGGVDRRYTGGRVPDHADVICPGPQGSTQLLAFDRRPTEGPGWVGQRLRALGLDPRDESQIIVETR